MPKELFNQTLKTTLDDSDRVAVSIPGAEGGNNITAENFLKQSANWNILTDTFDNGDLVANVWSLNHAKNTLLVRMTLYNPAGFQENINGMFQIVDADNVEIDFGGAITAGDWTYILEYILI